MAKEQEQKQDQMRSYGLIGKDIDYSFSRNYFKNKFSREKLEASYVNFDIANTQKLRELLHTSQAQGYNVTIPYKEDVMPLLDTINSDASQIGAVNTIKRTEDGRLIGYNTDYIGFRDSLLPLISDIDFDKETYKALILGTGGASKGVKYALDKLGIDSQFISRKRTKNRLTYSDIDEQLLNSHKFVINTTPLGTFPDIESCPDIPYQFLSSKHIVYDLIYNPSQTLFLQKAAAQGAQTINGLKMLELQAEASWELWNS